MGFIHIFSKPHARTSPKRSDFQIQTHHFKPLYLLFRNSVLPYFCIVRFTLLPSFHSISHTPCSTSFCVLLELWKLAKNKIFLSFFLFKFKHTCSNLCISLVVTLFCLIFKSLDSPHGLVFASPLICQLLSLFACCWSFESW